MHDFSLEVTLRWAGGAPDQRVLECARDENTMMFLTPSDDTGRAAFVIMKDGRIVERASGTSLAGQPAP